MSEGLPRTPVHKKIIECVTGPVDLPQTSLRRIDGESPTRLQAILDFRVSIVPCLLRAEWLYMLFACVRFQFTWLHEPLLEGRQLSQSDGTESEGSAFELG